MSLKMMSITMMVLAATLLLAPPSRQLASAQNVTATPPPYSANSTNTTSNSTSPPAAVNATRAYLLNFTASSTPWAAGSSSSLAPSSVAAVSGAKLTLGACAYRQLHIHALADETYFQINGTIESFVLAPNNTGTTNVLSAGDAVVYPQGWQHYQYNPTCSPAMSVQAFNAPSSGTINTILNIAQAPLGYLYSAYGLNTTTAPLPLPAGLWVLNCRCAQRCGISPRTLACP